MVLTPEQREALELKASRKHKEQLDASALDNLTDVINRVAVKGEQGLQGEQGLPGVNGQDGKQGPVGPQGPEGPRGPAGPPGKDGEQGPPGKRGERGYPGKDGKPGQKGKKGDSPRHQISKDMIRFEQADGSWGDWISLKNVTIKGGGGGAQTAAVTTESVVYSTDVEHLNTLQDFINHAWSTGASGDPSEFVLTENGDGTIDITSGVAVLSATNDRNGELKAYTVPGVTSLALTDEATNYVQVDYNNGDPIISATTDFNDVAGVRTKTTFYAVNRLGTQLNIVDIRGFNVDYMRKNAIKDYKSKRFEHSSGAFISDLNNRNIAISASEFYLLNEAIQSAALDTSVAGVFEYVYSDGLGGWNRVASQTQIDNVNYDEGGTLTIVGNNKYVCHYVFIVLNAPSHYKVVYGQSTYNTLEEAEAEQIPSILPSDLDALSTGVFIGKIIVQQAVDSFITIQSPFTQILTSAIANNHANLAGLQGGKVGEYYHLDANEKDNAVIEAANAPNSTLSYTGDLLTGVTFVNTTEITNNSKILSYGVGNLLETITHTFDYLAQTWTVTTPLSYTSGKLTGKSTTIGKV